MTVDNGGLPDPQGWTSVDRTAQLDTFFHIDGSAGALDGIAMPPPLEGNQSLWCGVDAGPGDPYCSWKWLPGYGHCWRQFFESDTFIVSGDVTVSYLILVSTGISGRVRRARL